jgi:hypothetical protein
MFYYDCECKDIKKNLNFQIFSSKNKKTECLTTIGFKNKLLKN